MFKKLFAFMLLAMGIYSCSEDFKVAAPYKNVMIVYGLLNSADTAQYIKITRGFFDEKGNNLLSAKSPDSLYHSNLDVKLVESNSANVVIREIKLDKVNLVQEGYVKDTGIFASTPAYAYKTKETLKDNFNYTLKIVNPTSGATITGKTTLLSKNPNQIKLENYIPGLSALNFADPTQFYRFTWRVPDQTGVTELWLRFHYLEVIDGIQQPLRFVDLPLIRNELVLTSNPIISVDYPNAAFIGSIKNAIKPANASTKRYVDSADILVYAGGKELTKYMSVAGAQGGITADQIKPIYTNLTSSNPSVEDVYGLFDTRVNVLVREIPYNKATIDSLVSSLPAKDLNFAGVSPL